MKNSLKQMRRIDGIAAVLFRKGICNRSQIFIHNYGYYKFIAHKIKYFF